MYVSRKRKQTDQIDKRKIIITKKKQMKRRKKKENFAKCKCSSSLFVFPSADYVIIIKEIYFDMMFIRMKKKNQKQKLRQKEEFLFRFYMVNIVSMFEIYVEDFLVIAHGFYQNFYWALKISEVHHQI